MNKRFLAIMLSFLVLGAVATFSLSSCGEESFPPQTEPPATTRAAYSRQKVEFFKGITDPSAAEWEEMVRDSDTLKKTGFNGAGLSPPVLITARAGGRPRVIFEGEASLAEGSIDSFHDRGFAVYVAPTTRIAGFSEEVDATDATLDHLTEDAVKWAGIAEAHQAELFCPLSRYNLVLGTEAANRWSDDILASVKVKYRGPLAAEAVADIGSPPAPGEPHDFEKLDLKGYDFLLLDLFPRGEIYADASFEAYVNDVLARAAAVVQRDGLEGFMIGQFGARRDGTDPEAIAGPVLTEEQQARAAEICLKAALPRVNGFFYYGWSAPGWGAQSYAVEQILTQYLGQ
jgi:hypothetical protein